MPFKTRRHKIAAAQRRYTFADGKVSLNDSKESGSDSGQSQESKYVSDSGTDAKSIFFGRELIKIILISAVIISAQVALRLTLF